MESRSALALIALDECSYTSSRSSSSVHVWMRPATDGGQRVTKKNQDEDEITEKKELSRRRRRRRVEWAYCQDAPTCLTSGMNDDRSFFSFSLPSTHTDAVGRRSVCDILT